jgi:hypothetical protein
MLMMTWMQVSAQQVPTPRHIHTEARLESVLILRMDPERYVEFGIEQVNEDLYHITKHPEDVMFSVESTGNWDLSISANEPYFTGENDESHKVPVDFIGLTIENMGTNWDNGLFSNIANATKDTILYLEDERTELLASGMRGNIGGSEMNSFILRWKFFYEDESLRTLKFSNFNIPDDLYKVGYTITLSESAKYPANEP